MMSFWDGVLVSNMLWFIASSVCLLLGYCAGSQFDNDDWCAGYDAGWKTALKTYLAEIYEKEEGMNI